MTTIDVREKPAAEGYEFQVTIKEPGGQTIHRVTLSESDYRQLAGAKASPEALVAESFRFLLEREPKETILRSFDLTLIGYYFPEFEQEIGERL